MKVILVENIKKLGNKGEIKDVSEGYARNFLVPKKLVEIATPEAIEKVKLNQKKIQEQEEESEENFKKIASGIQGKKITLKAKAEKEKLFGRVGTKEIANELKKQNFNINEKSIILAAPIKTTGEKAITIDFGKNIKAKITVLIEKA
ncbi:MAG: 50S ribosomal protein L9 [Parcubacteria group bacterium]|jgi:large subunit ribosomal protein L9